MQKAIYFTQKSIQRKSNALLEYVVSARQRHSDIVFQPEKAALLVLDMQRYFLDFDSHAFVPSAPATIPGINKLINAFVKAERPVVATRQINTFENAGMMSKWWRGLISSQSAHNQYIQALSIENTIQLEKTQYDAFLHTSLEETLHARQIEQVVITGVMTHLCCETTARSAFMRGFEIFFTVDGTATYNEELHRASLLTLSHGFAVPVLIEELVQAMETNGT
jgi:bifunctional isochorismate lyase/aryl carrier protein